MDEVDINAPTEALKQAIAKEKELEVREAAAALPTQTKPLAIPKNPLTPPKNVPPVSPTIEPGHESHLAGVRTYSGDLANAIRESQGSIVKIAIAEDERRRQERVEFEQAPKRNFAYILLGLLLIALAGAIVYGALWYKKEKNSVVVPPPAVPESIIRSDGAEAIDVGGKFREDVIATVRETVLNPDMRPGTVKNILPSKKVGGAENPLARIASTEFLSLLSTHAPAEFSRALDKEYMLGIYLYDRANLFLVLRGQGHDYLLSGMIGWEPFLFSDIAPLFGLDTKGDAAAYLNTPWKDTIIENRDARAVLDENKSPVLFYSFIDPDTIFFATDPKTFTEGIRRLK